jgi:hypothetical protein
LAGLGLAAHRPHQCLGGGAVLERGDQLGQCAPRGLTVALQCGQLAWSVRRQVLVAAHHHLADHSLQAHPLTVFRAVDAGDAIVLQLADFRRHDHPAAAAEHLDVGAAALAQQVDHVAEVLDVPTLVARHRDALHVLLQRCSDDLVHRAVVAEVDHLGAHAL